MDWTEHITYWEHNYPQLSSEWFKERWRLTASLFGAIANPTYFKGPVDVVAKYRGEELPPTRYSQMIMNYGITTEPEARNWYSQRYNKVKEVGLCVPKWDNRIGSSPDGIISKDGLLEIKCPSKMYPLLWEYVEMKKKGWKSPPSYHSHIYDSHYDQMQGNIAITGRKWCDYIVYCPNENVVFIERIYFNYWYWWKYLYPKLSKFLDTYPNLFPKEK